MGKALLLLFILLLVASPVLGQEEVIIESTSEPYPCPYQNAVYYQPGAFPRYDASSRAIVLVDANSAPIRVLDQITENVRVINWSLDCHYLTGAIGKIKQFYSNDSWTLIHWENRSIVIWDATTGIRLQTVENRGRYLSNPAVIWSPDSRFALIRGGCGSVHYSCQWERYTQDWLWQSAGNMLIAIGQYGNERNYPRQTLFNQYAWDFERGLLWGNAINNVSSFDLNSGAEVRSFSAGSSVEGRFAFSTDRTRIIIYGTPDFYGNWATDVGVYDIASGTGEQVNIEGYLFPQVPFVGDPPIALSPDNRYLVIGHDALRVWDMQNLPANLDERLPIYRHSGPSATIQGVRFTAPDVIETTSAEGVQRWDLHSGINLQ